MNGLPNEFFQRWSHSFEEDAGDVTVYRPDEYPLPPARGRAGIEFRLDGTFIDWMIGPADGSVMVRGIWQFQEPNLVRVFFEGGHRAPRDFEIIRCDANVLMVR